MSLTLFDTMRPAAIALFTSVFEIHTYGPGDVIVKEGQSGDFFYVPGTYMKISRPRRASARTGVFGPCFVSHDME
ncbi:hypothetical protein JL720_8535 [Aureococcus anophagefferens]|nr:hypothetical protein JL720_8535 [Aureococcus anophagefferens]